MIKVNKSILVVLFVLFLLVIFFCLPYLFSLGISLLFNYQIDYNWKLIIGFWILFLVFRSNINFNADTIKN